MELKAGKEASGIIVSAILLLSAGRCLGGDQSEFADGQQEQIVVFPPGGGENSSAAIVLPAGMLVLNATVDIEGRKGLNGSGNYTADFLVPRQSTAWAGNLTVVPPVLAPASYEKQNITMAPGIKASDDLRTSTMDTNTTAYHMFEVHVGQMNVSSLALTWEGIGFTHPEIGIGSNGALLYLWDRISRSWDVVDAGGYGEVPYELLLNGNVSINPARYVDSSNRVCALVHPTYPMQYWTRVDTDYLGLSYSAWASTYPENLSLDVGADGALDWSRPGPLDQKVTFSGPAFISALQGAVDNATGANVSIPLRFASATGGMLYLANLSIQYRPKDMPPVLKKPVPEVPMQEDTALPAALELSEHIEDDGGAGNLGFELTWAVNPGGLRSTFNGTRLDLLPGAPDWFGDASARIRATDAAGQWVETGNFSIIVAPVNDPPVLERPGELLALEGTMFTWRFNATDPDDTALKFTTNWTALGLNPADGTVVCSFGNGDVGRHDFWVMAEDHEGAADKMNVGLTVANANNPPVLGAIKDQTAVEHEPFSLQLQFSDPDLEIGQDRLAFACEPAVFNISPEGLISLIPDDDDVGTRIICVSVTDIGGLKDTRLFALTVTNVNDPPRMTPPGDLAFEEDRPVHFRMNATDQDSADRLAFSSAAGLFTIEPDGWIRFTPLQRDVGTHLVQVTVTDKAGARDSVNFNITIINVNDPPRDARILHPEPGRVYSSGLLSGWQFRGNALDEDGDRLEYRWYLDGTLVASGQNATVKDIGAGEHGLRLEVSDGQYSSNSPVLDFRVKKAPIFQGPDPTTAGTLLGIMVLLAAALAVFFIAVARIRGREE